MAPSSSSTSHSNDAQDGGESGNGNSNEGGNGEGDGGKEWHRYSEYLRTTSILIPMPKAVWKRLPVWVKRSMGCEWPMYVFVPERDVGGDSS